MWQDNPPKTDDIYKDPIPEGETELLKIIKPELITTPDDFRDAFILVFNEKLTYDNPPGYLRGEMYDSEMYLLWKRLIEDGVYWRPDILSAACLHAIDLHLEAVCEEFYWYVCSPHAGSARIDIKASLENMAHKLAKKEQV